MPQASGTLEIIDIFNQVLNKKMQTDIALEKLATFHPYGKCNGYWFSEEGMLWINNSSNHKDDQQNC